MTKKFFRQSNIFIKLFCILQSKSGCVYIRVFEFISDSSFLICYNENASADILITLLFHRARNNNMVVSSISGVTPYTLETTEFMSCS